MDDGLAKAEALLSGCEISVEDHQGALALASLLDDYNNGLIGPPKCDFCGDGTVKETASWIVNHRSETPLAIIPSGSANLLALTLFPQNWISAI